MKKLIKRGFAALLALTLALGMSVSAFAIEGTAAAGIAIAKKDYQRTNLNTTSPAETFTFTAEAENVTDANNPDGSKVTKEQMPSLTIDPISYNDGEAGSDTRVKDLRITSNKDFPSVGIYTYKVTETPGNTAGVTYNKKDLTLIATVHYNDNYELVTSYAFKDGENKTFDIVNTYSAGTLQVGKHVDGNLGNKAQKFNIDVTFTAPANQTVKSTITYGNEEITPAAFDNENHTVTVTISLAAEQSIVFYNVPYGVTYKVQEKKYDGYTTTYTKNSETPEGADYVQGTIKIEHTVADILNTKNGTVDTGVILHSAPYVLLLVGVGAAAVAFLILKKHREV